MENLGLFTPLLMSVSQDTILSFVAILVGLAALGISIYEVNKVEKVLSETSKLPKLDTELHQVLESTSAQLRKLEELEAEIQQVLDGARTQLAHLEVIKGSSSTYYLHKFPLFIPNIINLIAGVDERLLIFCDIPAYGNFTAPHDFKKYCLAIQDLRERKSKKNDFVMELVFLRSENRLSSYDEILQDWEQWRDEHSEELREFLLTGKRFWCASHLLKEEELIDKRDSLKPDDFKSLLESVNDAMAEETFSNIEFQYIQGRRMPIFFWLADDREAVFSIPAYRKEHTELGFHTSDGNLIRALLAIKERYVSPTI